MSISESTQRALAAFQSEALLAHSSRLPDELGRFRVWVADVCAHRPEAHRRSLEYKLRDNSELQDHVLSLLQDLIAALASIGRETSDSTQIAVHLSAHDSDHDLFALEDFEPPTTAEMLTQDIYEIADVLNCLTRLSPTLKNAAPSDLIRKRYSTQSFEPYDLQHVRAKFPQAPQYLVHRLGMAISRHRMYLQYRRERHEEPADSLVPLQTTNR
nr:hypothetical protein CFP56_52273 [Quercus suber]